MGLCKVQLLLITIQTYCLFDMSANSKRGADAFSKVLPNAPDIRN